MAKLKENNKISSAKADENIEPEDILLLEDEDVEEGSRGG